MTQISGIGGRMPHMLQSRREGSESLSHRVLKHNNIEPVEFESDYDLEITAEGDFSIGGRIVVLAGRAPQPKGDANRLDVEGLYSYFVPFVSAMVFLFSLMGCVILASQELYGLLLPAAFIMFVSGGVAMVTFYVRKRVHGACPRS